MEKILEKASTLVSIAKSQTEERLRNPRIQQWDKVNADLHASLMTSLGIDKKLKSAQSQYHELAKSLFEQMARWQNEIGNLQTDIKHNSVSESKAKDRAMEIEKGCLGMVPENKKFITLTDQILSADRLLRDQLTFDGLLILARELTTKKPRLIDEGFQVFCAVAQDDCSKCTGTRLQEILDRESSISKKLQSLDLSSLPGMAADVVSFHVGAAIAACAQIRQSILDTITLLESEFTQIEQIKSQAATLREAPPAEIINAIEGIAKNLGTTMIKFQGQAGVLTKLNLSQALLENLNLFFQTMRSDFLVALKNRIQEENSPLKPATLARKQAENFFMGFTGLLRMVKLLLGNLSSAARLNEEELARRLEHAITSCTIYLSKQKSDIQKLEKFIGGYLEGYPKPFPYNPLFQLIRKTLAEYGARLEKFFDSFPITGAPEEKQASGSSAKQGATTVNKLLSKIEIRLENLKTS